LAKVSLQPIGSLIKAIKANWDIDHDTAEMTSVLLFAYACAGLLFNAPSPTIVVQASSSTLFQRSWRQAQAVELATATLLARDTGNTGAFPISGLIDDIDPATTAMDAKAAAMRAQLAEEQRIMDARDEVAIRRMAEVQAARQRELEAQKASGVPFCAENDPTKVLGDSGRTGVLTAKACQRVRTGLIETGPRTGALLIF
jgi:hypothetical protein